MIVGLRVRTLTSGSAIGTVIVEHEPYQATNLGVKAAIDLSSRGISAAWNGLRNFFSKPEPVVVIDPQVVPPSAPDRDDNRPPPEPIMPKPIDWVRLKPALDAFLELSGFVFGSAVRAFKLISAEGSKYDRLLRSWTLVCYEQFGDWAQTTLSPDQAIMVRQHSATLSLAGAPRV